MRVVTLLIILAIIGGVIYVGHTQGWWKKGEAAADSFTAHFQKGSSLYQTEKYAEAVEAMKKALEVEPDHPNAVKAMARLGDIFRDWGMAAKESDKTKKAIEWYDKAIKAYPDADIIGRVKQSKLKTEELGGF